MAPAWTISDLPSLAGRIAVVTGANSGLGLVTARELARAGARVVLAVRDVERGRSAAATMEGEHDVRRLDLADLSSVRAFAKSWEGDLDLLVNNAGVMAIPLQRTAEGFEMQLGTNHLGHFALSNLLLPHMTHRVVTVSSIAHRGGHIDLEDLNWQRRRYRPWGAYQQSKLANLLFTLELQRRLSASGSSVRALAAHPGYSATNLQSHSASRVAGVVMSVLNRTVAQSDGMGASPTLYAATQDLPGGSYVGPHGLLQLRGHPTLVTRTARASDATTAGLLWEASEQLTGVRSPIDA
ncbi:MAG: oxidoreductase [Actinomycetota bacterium]|nr:oxidoreductase [Actinomycetota bacterium]